MSERIDQLTKLLIDAVADLTVMEQKRDKWRHIAARCYESIGHTACCPDCVENGAFAQEMYEKALRDE